jgi:hypothetical protein
LAIDFQLRSVAGSPGFNLSLIRLKSVGLETLSPGFGARLALSNPNPDNKQATETAW